MRWPTRRAVGLAAQSCRHQQTASRPVRRPCLSSTPRSPGRRQRVRIVPKTDFAACGITICSISRYLALFYESVELRWRRVETRTPAVPGCGYNIVLLPWSLRVRVSDFHLVKSAVGHVDSEVFGFFEFAPRVSLNPGNVSALLSLACAEFGMIDAVIFARGCRTAARGQRPGIRPRRVRGEVPDRRRTAPSKGWRLRWQLSPFGVRTPAGWQRHQQDKHHRFSDLRPRPHDSVIPAVDRSSDASSRSRCP